MNSKPETPSTLHASGRSAWAENSQLIIAWEITRRCELKCRHCRGAARDCDYADEFSTEECFKTVDALAVFSNPIIILTGGEPLMRTDIFEVARYATDKGCRVVLATCGHLLTTEITAKLKAAGVMAVSVSLDAATAEAHNAFRGVEGAYEKTLAGLELLKHAGIPFQINTTVSKLNVTELPQILEKAVALGAATVDFFFLVPTGRGSEMADLALTPAERDRALEWIAGQAQTAPIRVKTTCAPQYKRFLNEECQRSEGLKSKVDTDSVSCNSSASGRSAEGGKLETSSTRNPPFRGCMGGRGFVFISHTGILQPCGFLDLPCGDLRTAGFDFETLYRNAEVFKNMRTLNPFAGCPARAYARTGDYMNDENKVGQASSLSAADRSVACVDRLEACPTLKKTMDDYSIVEKQVLTKLQRGIAITSRPFQTLELPEADVLALLHRAHQEGLLRRFGGVFDARRLGYKSILCALDVPTEQLAEKAALIAAHPGVTHCYERLLLHGEGDYPLLWFTLAMLHDEFAEGVSALRAQLETRNSQLLELPALRRFKIDVVFDLQTVDRDETFPGIDSAHAVHDESFREFSEEEKKLVRALDQNIPLVGQPFAAVAKKTGQTEEAVLSTLQKWKEQGVLRRIGAILYHREAGFKANAMCVWPVSGDVSAAGRRVAARPEVSHCYQRPCLERFPFDLYAMIHTGSWEQTDASFKDISVTCGLENGKLFASGREFKKSSMQYFKA